MRKTLMFTALLAALGLTVAFGLAHTASAAPVAQSAEITLTNADIDALLTGAELDHRRPGRGGRELRACMDAVKAIHDACPCEGVDGQPWANHDVFMECVNTTAYNLKNDAANPLPEICVTAVDKAVERLDNSGIGDEGYECPSHECPGGPRGPREPREPGTPGGGS